MRDGARTAATVAVLGVILVVGAAWGWSAMTQPLPGKVELPTCESHPVAKGDKVYPDQVVVSVLNAGTREGLAGRTMQLLTDQGFAEGDNGNVSTKKRADVGVVQIWTDDPGNPAVRLVATRLGTDVKVLRHKTSAAGVVVVVGDGFKKLRKGRQFVKAAGDTEICGPPQT